MEEADLLLFLELCLAVGVNKARNQNNTVSNTIRVMISGLLSLLPLPEIPGLAFSIAFFVLFFLTLV